MNLSRGYLFTDPAQGLRRKSHIGSNHMLRNALNDLGILRRERQVPLFERQAYNRGESFLHRYIRTRYLQAEPGFILRQDTKEFFMSWIAH